MMRCDISPSADGPKRINAIIPGIGSIYIKIKPDSINKNVIIKCWQVVLKLPSTKKREFFKICFLDSSKVTSIDHLYGVIRAYTIRAIQNKVRGITSNGILIERIKYADMQKSDKHTAMRSIKKKIMEFFIFLRNLSIKSVNTKVCISKEQFLNM